MSDTPVQGPRSSTDPTIRLRTYLTAASMVIGPVAIMAANVTFETITNHREFNDNTAENALDLIGHVNTAAYANAGLLAMIGALFLVPAALGVGRVVRDKAPWLGLIASVWVATAYIAYFAINLAGFVLAALHSAGVEDDQALNVLQAAGYAGDPGNPHSMWVYILFVSGNVLGTILLGVALIRAKIGNRVAGILLVLTPFLHFLPLPYAEGISALAQVAAFGMAARALLRSPATAAGSDTPYELLRK